MNKHIETLKLRVQHLYIYLNKTWRFLFLVQNSTVQYELLFTSAKPRNKTIVPKPHCLNVRYNIIISQRRCKDCKDVR